MKSMGNVTLTGQLIEKPDLFKKKLILIRSRLGLTQIEMASKLGVSLGAYSNWEAGRRLPRPFYLKTISDLVGITMSQLTNTDPEIQFPDDMIIDMGKGYDPQTIPLFSGRTFCGLKEYNEVLSQALKYPIKFPDELPKSKFFAFKVEGGAMETMGTKTIPHESIALCYTRFDVATLRGKTVVAAHGNEPAVIREFDTDGQNIVLRPWNSAYQTIVDTQENVRIYGRVVRVVINFE